MEIPRPTVHKRASQNSTKPNLLRLGTKRGAMSSLLRLDIKLGDTMSPQTWHQTSQKHSVLALLLGPKARSFPSSPKTSRGFRKRSLFQNDDIKSP